MRRRFPSFLLMRLYPMVSGGCATLSGGLYLRTPSLAYLNRAVDGQNRQSEPRTLSSATIPWHPRTVKAPSNLWSLGSESSLTDVINDKRMPVHAVVEVSPMCCERNIVVDTPPLRI